MAAPLSAELAGDRRDGRSCAHTRSAVQSSEGGAFGSRVIHSANEREPKLAPSTEAATVTPTHAPPAGRGALWWTASRSSELETMRASFSSLSAREAELRKQVDRLEATREVEAAEHAALLRSQVEEAVHMRACAHMSTDE